MIDKNIWYGLILVCGACTSAAQPPPAGELLLDFTAYVEGAIQVSGIGVHPEGHTVALVTDFAQVILVDPATVQVDNSFSAQLGDLPEQGSTEAIAFRPDGLVAVLYPEHFIIRTYDPEGDGTVIDQIALPPAEYRGAMVVLDSDIAVVPFVDGPNVVLRAIDLDDAEIELDVTLSVPLEAIEGLGLDGSALVAVTRAGMVHEIDWMTGNVGAGASVSEVGEPSAIEPLINSQGEDVLVVCDDDDQYNAEPGPIRLYLR